MANLQLKLVVGKDPHAEIYGFSISGKNDYGTVIPDKVEGELLGDFTFGALGAISLALPSDVFGGTALKITTATGLTADLTYAAGAYTGTSADIVTAATAHKDSVFELAMETVAVVVTASTPEPEPTPTPTPKRKRKKASEE